MKDFILRKRGLIISIIVVLFIVIGLLVWIGITKRNTPPGGDLTEEQRRDIIKSTTATGSSTLTAKEETTVIKNTSASESTSTKTGQTVAPEKRSEIINSMSAK